MNLTTIYSNIKSIIQANPAIKLVTWFNNQIEEGIIHTEPAVFIQFPDTFNIDTLGHDHYQQAPMVVTIHLVTKLHQAQDGSVNDQSVAAHQTIAQNIFDSLHKTNYLLDNKLIYNTLARTRFQFDMSNPGWAVTIQTFEAMAYQHPVSERYTTVMAAPVIIVPRIRTIPIYSLGSAFEGTNTVVTLYDALVPNQDVVIGSVVLFINNSANPYTIYPGEHEVTYGIGPSEFIIAVPYDDSESAADFSVQLVSVPE